MAADIHYSTEPLAFKSKTPSVDGAKELALKTRLSLATTAIDEANDLIPLFAAPPFFTPSQIHIVTTDIDGATALVYSVVLTNATRTGHATRTDYNVITGITTGQAAGVYDSMDQAYAVQLAIDKYVPEGDGWWFALKITTAAGTPAAGTMIVTIRGVAQSFRIPQITAFS
jgi:hypothetical protein